MSETPSEPASSPVARGDSAPLVRPVPSVLVALGLLLLAYAVMAAAVWLVAAILEQGLGLSEPAAFRWSMLVGQGSGMLLFPVLVLWLWGHSIGQSLGLNRPRLDALFVTLGGAFCMVVTCQSLGEWASRLLPVAFRDFASYVEELLPKVATPDVGTWLVVMLTVALAPAICEEALFRGLTLGALRRRAGVVVAVLVSSLLFALAHATPVALATTFLLGVTLAVVAVLSGSIWCAVVLHLINNILVVEQANRVVPYVVTARVEPVAAWSVIPAGMGTLLMLGVLVWLRRRGSKGLRSGAGFSAAVCLAVSVVSFCFTLAEAREWLNRCAVYHATVAPPGSGVYQWAHSQDWIRPEHIRQERERLWQILCREEPSAPGARELAGLITQQADAAALERAWAWFQQAGPEDDWQAALLGGLQRTRFGRRARPLAWSRLAETSPEVGLALAHELAEGMTPADRTLAREVLAMLPAKEPFNELRQVVKEMANRRLAPAQSRPAEDNPVAPGDAG